MVAFPMIGAGPYGTSRSVRSSVSATSADAPKLDAQEIENIFQSINYSQDRAMASTSTSTARRFGWFSRQYNKKFRGRSISK